MSRKLMMNNIINNSNVDYVKYIESTGTQYIDTKISVLENIKVVMKYKFNILMPKQNMFCIKQNTDSYDRFHFGFTGSTINMQIGNDQGVSTIYLANYLDIYTIIMTLTSFVFYDGKDEIATSGYIYNKPNSNNIYLFARNGLEELNFCNANIYYCKIFDGDNLIRNLNPCLDNNGIACMYDEISQQYFYNKGTGNFNYSR